MRKTPRFFSSDLTPRERRVYGAVAVFTGLVFLALSWPVYALFSGIRPLILGMPLSMFYIVAVLVATFLVMLALYWWERGRGVLDGDAGDPPADRRDRGEEEG